MNKRLLVSFIILFILGVLAGTQIPYGKQNTGPAADLQCPSLDELLYQEMPKAFMKLEAPTEDLVLSSKPTVVQEDEVKGVRIVLRYDDKETLLKRANTYGLTTNKVSSQVPYYFTLNGTGGNLYFERDVSFRKFLLDIGGQEVLGKAKKEIVVSLVSGSHFKLIEYQ